jgi:hypothetical protein
LQPGVAPTTTITGGSIQAAGAAILSPSGNLNPGTISINGQREYANGFTVNDADVVERFTMGVAIVPNLDSIAEFRILTGNFDAEYGNYSGGRINVVTKSGSNQFHGSAFEFLRNTDLDSRNFYSPDRGVYQQNPVRRPLRRTGDPEQSLLLFRLPGNETERGCRYGVGASTFASEPDR